MRSLEFSEFELESSPDRNGIFEHKIVAKRQLIITDELKDKLIAMYARGMSTRNIFDYVHDIYARYFCDRNIEHNRQSDPSQVLKANLAFGSGLPFPSISE